MIARIEPAIPKMGGRILDHVSPVRYTAKFKMVWIIQMIMLIPANPMVPLKMRKNVRKHIPKAPEVTETYCEACCTRELPLGIFVSHITL
jgi:hypothetical protein